MTLSALGRLRALPTIALALALAAALAGCSTSEPAEETPAPAPAEEPAAPKTPAEEEAEEPEPAAPAIDKSQLVTAQTTYSEELIDDPDTFEATYTTTGASSHTTTRTSTTHGPTTTQADFSRRATRQPQRPVARAL